jgi:5-methylcytosine-specific restriction endonuclease McrA
MPQTHRELSAQQSAPTALATTSQKTDEVKLCIECGVAPRGKNSYCKECDAQRARGYYQRHKAERQEYHQKRYQKAKTKKKRQARYQATAEQRKAASKKYYEEHREERLEYFKSERGKAVNKSAALRRKARMLAQTEPSSPRWNRAQIIERDRSICYWCGQQVPPEDLHLDHINPIAKGGSDSAENVAVTHKLCNLTRPRKYRDPRAEALRIQLEAAIDQELVGANAATQPAG